MGLSKLMRAALTVNPLARTMTAKKLAQTRTRLEKILQEGSEATEAQKTLARKKLAQMDRVEAREAEVRSMRASKSAPKGSAREKAAALPPLKSLENLPDDFDKGGMPKKKKVPVIAVSVGMAEMKKDPSKKAKMMRGGTANKKEHMYSAGGSVTDKLNPGLRALNKTRPDVVANILKKS